MTQETIIKMSKTEILCRLLKKEHGYYEAILDITQQENRKFLNKRPFSEIAPLLKKKKILLSCIDDVEKALTPIKNWWNNKQYDPNDPWTEKAKIELQRLNQTVQQILELDKINQKQCQQMLTKLKVKS